MKDNVASVQMKKVGQYHGQLYDEIDSGYIATLL